MGKRVRGEGGRGKRGWRKEEEQGKRGQGRKKRIIAEKRKKLAQTCVLPLTNQSIRKVSLTTLTAEPKRSYVF